MKLRLSVIGILIALTFTACGSRFFVVKDKYDSVKKVALVQYTINPHIALGTASTDDAKWEVVAKNLPSFVKAMSGSNYVVSAPDEVLGNAAYKAAGKEHFEGYYTGKGMRVFSDVSDQVEAATISPEQAKALCAALNVDAVAVVYDSWGIDSYAMGFKGRTMNTYVLNMFDKEGNRVWGDTVTGSAEEGFPMVAGVISTDVPTWVLNNNQSFEAALATAKTHFAP